MPVGEQYSVKKKTCLEGTVNVPPDKSITHRGVLFSALARGKSLVKNPLNGEDCLSSLRCVEKLGCKVQKNPGAWVIEGPGLHGLKKQGDELDCGNSGTTMRLLSGILAAQDFSITLFGDESLNNRPMKRVADPLSSMGASFSLRNEKFPPFLIKGNKNLKPADWVNPVASAQVKSAVLLAGLHAEGRTVYQEPSLSRDHTERMLKAAGVPVESRDGKVFIKGPNEPTPMEWVVPRDFSSAAFFIVAGLLAKEGDLLIPNVNLNPTRTGLLQVLKCAGAEIPVENQDIIAGEEVGDLVIKAGQTLKGFNVEGEIIPSLIDEIPILAVAAALAEGESAFSGLEELRVKETDRIAALCANLRKMGVSVEEKTDGMIIQGRPELTGAKVSSFRDHRIAMAFAVAGLSASGETTIDGGDCVAISFPTFWDTFSDLCRR